LRIFVHIDHFLYTFTHAEIKNFHAKDSGFQVLAKSKKKARKNEGTMMQKQHFIKKKVKIGGKKLKIFDKVQIAKITPDLPVKPECAAPCANNGGVVCPKHGFSVQQDRLIEMLKTSATLPRTGEESAVHISSLAYVMEECIVSIHRGVPYECISSVVNARRSRAGTWAKLAVQLRERQGLSPEEDRHSTSLSTGTVVVNVIQPR